jgi:HTH-type transcriptional regulator/antitoxin HigA
MKASSESAKTARTVLDPAKYGRLCASAIPKVIANDKEFDRMVAKLEELTFKKDQTPEEIALAELLEKLIKDYDDMVELPDVEPYKIVLFLMEQRGLRQADLVPIFGSRSVASAVLNGKRELSKAHIRGLAEYFKLSPEVFF